MMRYALFSQFRSVLPRPTTKLNLRSFHADFLNFEPSAGKLPVTKDKFPGDQENDDDDGDVEDSDEDDPEAAEIDRAVEKTIDQVATQAITPQNAVQSITSLAKDQTKDTLYQICATLWEECVSTSRTSKDSAVSVANLLVHLSYQAQEDFEDQPRNSGPTMVPGDWGNKERLWHDMPGMWGLIVRMSDIPPDLPRDHVYQDHYFFSLLLRSRQQAFSGLDSYLSGPFCSATHWPPDDYGKWEAAIQTTILLLETAGARFKERVLDNHPNEWLVNVGQWRRWQRQLFQIAKDETTDLKSRAYTKQAADMMTIEKHLTNHWWRRWRRELSEITADPRHASYNRAQAKRINEILASENEEQEAAAARLLPLPPSLPLLLPP